MSRLENKTKGAALIFTAVWFLSLSGILIKLGSSIGAYKLVFFRFLIGLVLIFAITLSGKFTLVINDWKSLFLRGFTGSIAVFLSILAITKIGLSKGMVLFCSYTVFASIFSAIFLKERLRLINFITLFTAMIGIYLIAYETGHGFSLLVFGRYELLTITGAILAGMALTFIRKLHDTDNSLAIYFAQCFVGLWIFIIPAFKDATVFDVKILLILLGIGTSITIGQLIMTQGMKYIPVNIGTLMLLLEPVICYITGVFIFSEPLTITSLSGSILVIGSCASVLISRKT